jgi:hypothetical protein
MRSKVFQRTRQIGDVFITSSWLSSSSGTKPLPPPRWALPFIVRAFFNDTITVAIWTGFHVRLMRMLPHPSNWRAAMAAWCKWQCYSLVLR